MRLFHRLLLFLISLFAFAPAFTQSNETYAIVVGISKYRFIKPLTFADKDADLFSELLKSGAAGNIKPENLFILKNDSANAGNFWSALQRISNKKLNKGDRVYIFFAGHGDGVKGLNEYYLLLSDCQASNDGNNYLLSLAAIDMYRLKNRIGLLTNQGVEVVLILDACRTNELPGGYASQVFANSIVQTRVGEIAMLATGPGQVSIEDASIGNGHGLFTYNLIDAWSGRADNEGDGNKDREISLDEMEKWVKHSVSTMSAGFNVKQNPVFCCEENGKLKIGNVDSTFRFAWNKWKEMKNPFTSPVVVKAQRNVAPADSNLLALYNRFNDARKQNKLWGSPSADSYYEQMKTLFPDESITEEARYALASDFINFAQQKINLYLEGKDLVSLERLAEKADSTRNFGFLSDEYERMQYAVSEKWTIAAQMIEKAGKLLSSQNDSSLFYQLKPRIAFLFARGFINGEKETPLKFNQALDYSLQSFRADSSAAYIAECLALLYAYRNSMHRQLGETDAELGATRKGADTSMRYFLKAIELAPGWTNPYRGIAMKIFGHLRAENAFPYLHRALQLDPTDGNTYLMIGDLYRQRNPDSAMLYYRLALAHSGRSFHGRIYRNMAKVYLYPGHFRNAPGFKPDSIMHYSNKALASEPTQANDPSQKAMVARDVYLSIARAYEMQEKPEMAVGYYHKVIALFPDHRHANEYLIRYHVAKKNNDSIIFYSHRFLNQSPENAYTLQALAELYDHKLNYPDSAIHYYQLCLRYTKMKDLPNERLGYLLMEKDKDDPRALDYFLQSTQIYTYGWRPYYNIACYYANKGDHAKALEYLEKTLQLGLKNKKQVLEESYFKNLLEDGRFKDLMSKYFK